MSWSDKYKKSIDCNNPKGFSQKAHCKGKKKRNEDTQFEQITEEILDEKLITYNNRKPYGQVVFMAGGAGSGKGFAIDNFIDSASFKQRDVDEMKKQLQRLNKLGKIDIDTIIKKYGKNIKVKDLDFIKQIQGDGYTLQTLDLKKENHVYVLHTLVKAMGIKDKSLATLLLNKSNTETLPNILFDITAKDISDITKVVPLLKNAGYDAKNIHLTWVLTNYVTSIKNNKDRSRRVPEDILLQTHSGAANTIWGVITKALPRGMDGRIDVILNNRENTIFHTDKNGNEMKDKVALGFLSLPVKKSGGGIFSEKLWRKKLYKWVKDNAPDEVTDNMKESVNVKKDMEKFKNGTPIVFEGKLGQVVNDSIEKRVYTTEGWRIMNENTKGMLVYETNEFIVPDWNQTKRFDESIKKSLLEKLELFLEENVPTNPSLWSKAKAAAKRKFDVYPSAYANAFASKWYKERGGKWKTKSKSKG